MKPNGTKNTTPLYLIKAGHPILFYNNRKMAEKLGVSEMTLSRVLSRNQRCKKALAYFITKMYNPEGEINDYFERIM